MTTHNLNLVVQVHDVDPARVDPEDLAHLVLDHDADHFPGVVSAEWAPPGTHRPTYGPHEHYAGRFAATAEHIAAKLERMAADVRRQAEIHHLAPLMGQPAYGSALADILHTISWGLANLHLDSLARDATCAEATHVLPPPQEAPAP